MRHDAALLAKGVPAERIRKHGFTFRGKEAVIGKNFNLIISG